jgi:glycine/D-amino acid oxidase-like deaminating enzyme
METTWQKSWQAEKIYPELAEDITADVAIVGGGIAGNTLAYLLARAGKKVAVLERSNMRDTSHTAYTTAMVMAQVDTNFKELTRIFGREKAIKVWLSGLEAIDAIEKTILEENIDCEWKRLPAFIYANDTKEFEGVEEEAELVRDAGFNITLHQNGKGIDIPNAGYYELPSQAIFHPLKYCEGLRKAAEKYGASFYENTEVTRIKENSPAILYTKGGKVTADWVAIATYEPFNKPKELFAKKGLYLTYMYELSIPKDMIKEGLYVDGHNPYHYFRVDSEGTKSRMIIGGADHRIEIKMDPEKNYSELLEYAEKILNTVEYRVETKWRGGILETLDGLPYIGSYSKKHPNIFVVTGFTGNGLTYSRTAANIIADKILGKENIYALVFDPKRRLSLTGIRLKGMDYILEFIHGALRNMLHY